jgi:hypothetical protein
MIPLHIAEDYFLTSMRSFLLGTLLIRVARLQLPSESLRLVALVLSRVFPQEVHWRYFMYTVNPRGAADEHHFDLIKRLIQRSVPSKYAPPHAARNL